MIETPAPAKAAVAGSLRLDGWRLTVLEDRTVYVAGEGSRFEADQVRVLAALGGDVPEAVLDRLRVLLAWAEHTPDVSAQAALDLARLDERERALLAGEQAHSLIDTPSRPVRDLWLPVLVHDPNPLVRQALAIALPDHQKNTRPWFALLAADTDALVRAAVAINPNAPKDLRVPLATDPDAAVRLAAWRNPADRSDARISGDHPVVGTLVERSQGDARLWGLHAAWMALSESDDWLFRVAIASRNDAPTPVLDHFIKGPASDQASVAAITTTGRVSNRGWY